MKVLISLLALFALGLQVDGLKVLAVLPFGSKSHYAIGYGIVKSLLSVGHEVTVISPYPQNKAIQNFTDIGVTEIADKAKEGF